MKYLNIGQENDNYLYRMIVVKPKGGLCNYLRTIFSYYKKAQKKKEKLVVIWKIRPQCPGFFLEYFKPIKGIIFYKSNHRNLKIDYSGRYTLPRFNPNKMNLYRSLKINNNIQKIVKNNRNLLKNNYIAVHIRRTDHIKLAKRNKKYTSNHDFFKFIEKNKNKNLYIATDNEQTQRLFYNRYKNRVKILNKINDNNNRRQTSLKIAIIDLYTCVYANNFLGSGFSSFSKTIYNLRRQLK